MIIDTSETIPRANRGPSYYDSRPPGYLDRAVPVAYIGHGDPNSKRSCSQGHCSHLYSSGEESDHKSRKQRRDKNSRGVSSNQSIGAVAAIIVMIVVNEMSTN